MAVPVFDMPPPTAGFDTRAGWVVRHLMGDLGLTMEQAAGFVGNLAYESDEFKSLQELRPQVSGSRGGYGWAQWTASRRVAFEGWCADHGAKPSSDYANYCFVVAELRQPAWAPFLRRLRSANSLEAAAQITEQYYERPQEAIDGTFNSLPSRITKAKRALASAENMTNVQPVDPVEHPVTPPITPPVITPPIPAQDFARGVLAVKAIQAALALYGSYTDKIDGDWGEHTEDALGEMLKSVGVEAE